MRQDRIILSKSATAGKSEDTVSADLVVKWQSGNNLQRVMPVQVGVRVNWLPQNVPSSFRAALHGSTAVGRVRR